MSHFVCACGSDRFDIEHEPPGINWCRFVATCHRCGSSALVTGTNIDGRLSLRITGRLRFVNTDHDRDRRPRTAATCPASYEFRGDGCTFAQYYGRGAVTCDDLREHFDCKDRTDVAIGGMASRLGVTRGR